MEDNTNGLNPAATQQAVSQAIDQQARIDEVVDAEVTKITEFGAFVKFANGKKGLIHISQVADVYVKNVNDHLKIGDKVKAKIIKISPDGKIDLTLKTRKETPPRPVKDGISANGTRPNGRPRRQNGYRRFDDNGSRHEKMTSSPNEKPFRTANFEEKLKQFLKESEEVQVNLKKHIEEKQS